MIYYEVKTMVRPNHVHNMVINTDSALRKRIITHKDLDIFSCFWLFSVAS